MDAFQRAALAAAAAADKKASDIVVLHVGPITLVTEYFVICSGANPIQVRAIADSVRERMKENGQRPLGVEGYTAGRWILLDYGDVVVHVMHEEQRRYYGLERLWGDAEQVDVAAARA